MKYFLAVVREESITKASEVLHITQPTLSRQLAQLEEEVGVKLFDRGTRKIVVTDAGMLLRRRAEEIIALSDKTVEELLVQEEQVEGVLSVGAGEFGAMEQIAELCGTFREKYPRVRFDFYTATADVVKEQIEHGNMDVGILLEPVSMEKFEYIRLAGKERWAVLMREDDPLAQNDTIRAEQLESLPLILPRRLNVQGELANWFGERFERLNIACTGNLTTNIALLVRKGYGCAIVVEGSLPFRDGAGVVFRPLSPSLTASVAFAWKREQPMNMPMKKFIEHAKYFFSMNESFVSTST